MAHSKDSQSGRDARVTSADFLAESGAWTKWKDRKKSPPKEGVLYLIESEDNPLEGYSPEIKHHPFLDCPLFADSFFLGTWDGESFKVSPANYACAGNDEPMRVKMQRGLRWIAVGISQNQ